MTAGPTFEVRYTELDLFLQELRQDAEAHAIADDLVRLAVRNGSATLGQVMRRRIEGDDKTVMGWRTRFVLASYVSTRGQLHTLSAYCGVDWLGLEGGDGLRERQAGIRARISADTAHAVQVAGYRLQSAVQNLGLELRGGGLYIQQGEYLQDPDEGLEAVEGMICATCLREIYLAGDESWRHRLADRAEVPDGVLVWHRGRADAQLEVICPRCYGSRQIAGPGGRERRCPDCMTSPGVRLTTHHLADPELEGRLI